MCVHSVLAPKRRKKQKLSNTSCTISSKGRTLNHAVELAKVVAVFRALAFGWQAFDMAYKPFLNKALSSMDKFDPARDLDGDDDFADCKEKGSLSESDAFFSDENPIVA
ncbi:hypothetical protein NC652_032384 [Populus alba x Populus x berolinensis]|uniref:Uncharacterized protein n=1 Tax=Populus tomentosa TaxID=118781 RepID=A0A8X8C554_POPTO|nr:hypothetical protein POTOM_046179 [Populus tomentosa]KAJ6878826.1 hypothetical protein NC652_032384 [Populus alba x Populus x berolinensis]